MRKKKLSKLILRSYLINLILGFILIFLIVFSYKSLFSKVNYILLSLTILNLSFILAWNYFVYKEKIKKKIQKIGFVISSLFFYVIGFLFGIGILRIIGGN